VQREGDELAGVVVPVGLMPGDVFGLQELGSAQQGALAPELDDSCVEARKRARRLARIPVKVRHVVVVAVPVVVAMPRVSKLIPCSQGRPG
jgi:hypothetical protein